MRRKITPAERKEIVLRYFDDVLPIITMAELAEDYGVSQATVSNAIKYGAADLFLDYTDATGSGISAEEACAKLGIRNETVVNTIIAYIKTRFRDAEV